MKSKILNLFTILLHALLLLGIDATILNGQSLVTLLPTNTAFTSGQSQDIQKIATDAHTAGYRLVQIGSLTANQADGLLYFTIPGLETSSFAGQVELVENDDNGGTVWSGTIVGENGSYFSFGKNAFSATGYVKLNERFYSFLPLGGNKCILVKHDLTKYTNEVCKTNGEPSESQGTNECTVEYNDCTATIDILLLVTPEARAYLNGFDFWGLAIFSGMVNSSINQAFQNSDIPNKQVRIRGVENFSLTVGYTSPPNIIDDTQHLVDDLNAQSLRNQHKADIVVLLTNQGYFDADGGQTFGIVSQIKADNAHAYLIAEIPFLIAPRWTLAHEVGHIFGARHNRTNNGGNDDEDICAHARRFDDGDNIARRTILARMGNVPNDPFFGDGRILYYSNPDVDFNGAETGTTNNDNAKAIRNTGCAVGSYRSSPFFNVEIAGPISLCSPHGQAPVDYGAAVNTPAVGNPGVAPYTYAWSWSPNPNFSPSFSLGSAQSITIGTPLACPKFYLRLVVTSSDNITITRTKFINSAFCPECDEKMLAPVGNKPGSIAVTPNAGQQSSQEISNSSSVGLDASALAGFVATVHPNPSAGSPTIEISLEMECDVSIIVNSLNGAEIKRIDAGMLSAGFNSIKLDLVGVPDGIYFCKVLAGKSPQTLKLVVAK